MQGGQHQVTGQRGLDGDLSGFKIADFTEHDDVGILTQERPESLAEGHPGRLIDLHLHDALDVELHRVFDREQLGVDLVDVPQAGVEGGRLAATGRPGDRENAVGLIDGLNDEVVTVLGKAQGLEFQLHRTTIENTKHHGLAEGGRERRETEIHLFARDHRADTAVLREAFLGDVQVGHDLQTRSHGRGQMLGRRGHLIEGTVDAVADLELVFEGFEVDVRSAVLHRLHEDEIDELHHGDVVHRIVQGDGHAFGCVVFLGNFPVAPQFLQ